MQTNPFAEIDPRLVSYIDTIEPFFRRLPRGFRATAESIQGKRLEVKDCKDGCGNIWGYRACINQPSPTMLGYLARVQKQHWLRVSRADVALDFITATQEQAERLAQYLRQYGILLWRRKGFMVQGQNYIRWTEGRSNRNLVLYWDKPARTELDESPCAHLELKFLNTGAVRRAGLASIEALLRLGLIDVINLFSRNVKLLEFDADAFIARLVRQAVAHERQQHLERGKPNVHPVWDYNRSRLQYRFANLIRKIGLDTAQGFKDEHPRAAMRLKRHPVLKHHPMATPKK
jgi:hypothetical protein